MAVSALASDLVKKWEGVALKSYQDGGGVWTIGYGHTAGVTEGMEWTPEQASEALVHDLQVAELAVNHRTTNRNLNANQIAALASFVFNLGETNFAKSTLLKRVNEGDHIGAALALIEWHHDNGKKVKGLLRRRLDEAALYLS